MTRPGARSQNLQRHMDRLFELETLAKAHDGVARAVLGGRRLDQANPGHAYPGGQAQGDRRGW